MERVNNKDNNNRTALLILLNNFCYWNKVNYIKYNRDVNHIFLVLFRYSKQMPHIAVAFLQLMQVISLSVGEERIFNSTFDYKVQESEAVALRYSIEKLLWKLHKITWKVSKTDSRLGLQLYIKEGLRSEYFPGNFHKFS